MIVSIMFTLFIVFSPIDRDLKGIILTIISVVIVAACIGFTYDYFHVWKQANMLPRLNMCVSTEDKELLFLENMGIVAQQRIREFDGNNYLVKFEEPITIGDGMIHSGIIQTEKPSQILDKSMPVQCEYGGYSLSCSNAGNQQLYFRGMLSEGIGVFKLLNDESLIRDTLGIKPGSLGIRRAPGQDAITHGLPGEQVVKMPEPIYPYEIHIDNVFASQLVKPVAQPVVEKKQITDPNLSVDEACEILDGYFKDWDRQGKTNDPMNKI
jgi:hypothetical protein